MDDLLNGRSCAMKEKCSGHSGYLSARGVLMYRQVFLLLRPVRYRPRTYLSKLIAKNGVSQNADCNLVNVPGCKITQGVAYTISGCKKVWNPWH